MQQMQSARWGDNDMSEKKDNNILNITSSIWHKYSFIFVFVAILIVYVITIQNNGNTFNGGHLSAILSNQYTVIVGIMALGMALIIITGQIDLSVGSAMVLTTGVAISVFNITDSIFLTLIASLATGMFCGAVNGVLAAYAKMPPFIVTLGTMLIYRSLALHFVRAIPPEIVGSSSSQFAMISTNSRYDLLRIKFGTGSLRILGFSIPYIALLFVVLLVFLIIVSKKTKYGKSVYAVGSNEKATHLAGVNISRVKFSVFVITGLLVGFASLVQACKYGNITPSSSGTSFEMYAIIAVVLGGVSMSGGRGNLLGIFFGALSYTTINSIIYNMPSLSIDIQNAFQGMILILVVLVQTVGPAIKERFAHINRKEST